MNDPIRRQPSHVPANVTQQYADSLHATASLEDVTSYAEHAAPKPDPREGE
jgi:hypothetical protein